MNILSLRTSRRASSSFAQGVDLLKYIEIHLIANVGKKVQLTLLHLKTSNSSKNVNSCFKEYNHWNKMLDTIFFFEILEEQLKVYVFFGKTFMLHAFFCPSFNFLIIVLAEIFFGFTTNDKRHFLTYMLKRALPLIMKTEKNFK